MPDAEQIPIPAATLVLFREGGRPPELLMVERARAMAFAGGALVFPGGRVDPGDRALAATLPGDPDDIAGRIAAVRETIEETGVPVGLAPLPVGEVLAALRRDLLGGAAFGTALAAHGLTLDLDALVPFARWCPRHRHARIFDTRFYLARLPEGGPAAEVDATENVRVLWTNAADMLVEAEAGRARVIFPTRRNLERLAQFASFAEAAAHAVAHPVETVTPWNEERDGVMHLCIPEGLGYPVTSEPLAGVVRD